MLTRKTIEKLWEWHGPASSQVMTPVRFARMVEARVLENVIRNNTYDCIDSWNVPVLGKEQIQQAARKARKAAEETA